MMVITDGPRNLPSPILVLPQMNKPPLADSFRVFMSGMMEPVHATLEHPVSLHVEDLQRPRHQLPCSLSADILLHTLAQSRPTQCHSPLIVIKLHILHKERLHGSWC